LPPLGILASLAAYFIVSTGLFILVHRWLGRPKVEKKPVVLSWKIIALRAFFAGSVVAGAVAVAQVAPPYMTGVLATFPAALTSTMVIISLSQGTLFAQATGKNPPALLHEHNRIRRAGFPFLSAPGALVGHAIILRRGPVGFS
jgi:hypothetical protein